MTLPNPGVSLSLDQISTEAQLSASSPWYNRGPNLGAYQGVQWWKDNTETGFFPSSNISINDFYSKRSTSPVTPGSTTLNSSFNFVVPLYSVLTVTIRGGGGGGAGESGNRTGGGGGSGGFASSFVAFGSADGGGGGIPGGTALAGAGSDGSPAGGWGWGSGGAGGKNVLTLTNPISGGSGPAVGSSVFVTVGAGGAGGNGGTFWIQYPSGTYPLGIAGNLSSGSPGGNGSVTIQWA